jgi:hypothetical protein
MKKRITGFGVVALAAIVAQMVVASIGLQGCSSDDAADADASDGATGSDVFVDPCAHFTKAGDLCPVKTSVACFPECAIGGCFCLETPGGGDKRWTCTTDLSCVPDGSPIDDVNVPDAIVLPSDAGDDAGHDAGDAGHASDASDASAAADAADAADASDAAAASDANDGAIADAGTSDANDGASEDAGAGD